MSTFVIHEQMNHGKVNSCVKEDKTLFNTLRRANVNTKVASKNKYVKRKLKKPSLNLNMGLQTSQQQC